MMEDYPKTLNDLETRFPTEESCRLYLYALRWPDGFVCPRCGNNKAWNTSDGMYRCTSCSFKVSITTGTIFERTRKPLIDWFRVIWWVTGQKNGASAKGLQRILGIGSYETAWTWLHKIRRAMVRQGRDNLSGIIEVDEVFIGGEKHDDRRGRGASGKSLVLVAVERNEKKLGRIRLVRIDDASQSSLEPAIGSIASEGSTIRTDGWTGYLGLQKCNYIHEVVRKDSVVGENVLPGCNLVASLLKRWLGGTLQGAVSHDHLEYYLDEFTFRFNRRTSKHRGKLFYRLLQQAVITGVTTYNELKKGVRGRKPKPSVDYL